MQFIDHACIDPVLRGANWLKDVELSFGPRFNYAYQIFYLHSGSAEVSVGSNEMHLERGQALLYGPGDRHQMHFPKGAEVGTVCFSFVPLEQKKLAMGNRCVGEVDESYWDFADPLHLPEGIHELPHRFCLNEGDATRFAGLVQSLTGHFRRQQMKRPLLVKALLLQLIQIMLDTTLELTQDHRGNQIERILEHMRLNFWRSPSRAQVAKELAMSESRLAQILRRDLGTSYREFLERMRMDRAEELLNYTHLRIADIAKKSGYRDVSYFIRAFRKLRGISPAKFRR